VRMQAKLWPRMKAGLINPLEYGAHAAEAVGTQQPLVPGGSGNDQGKSLGALERYGIERLLEEHRSDRRLAPQRDVVDRVFADEVVAERAQDRTFEPDVLACMLFQLGLKLQRAREARHQRLQSQ